MESQKEEGSSERFRGFEAQFRCGQKSARCRAQRRNDWNSTVSAVGAVMRNKLAGDRRTDDAVALCRTLSRFAVDGVDLSGCDCGKGGGRMSAGRPRRLPRRWDAKCEMLDLG